MLKINNASKGFIFQNQLENQLDTDQLDIRNSIFKNKNHPLRKFGTWLQDVTGVLPWETSGKRLWTSVSAKEAKELYNKFKIAKELDINGADTMSLEQVANLIIEHSIEHVKDGKTLFSDFILPFETDHGSLKGVVKHPFKDIWLNYGPAGKGGQRKPKPQHIFEMLREWNPNSLSAGLARKDPITGRVYVNEGQQRSIAGLIVGRSEFAYQIQESEDTLIDTVHFMKENQGKLVASDVEIIYSNAVSIEETLKRIFKKENKDPERIEITDAIRYGLVQSSTETKYRHFEIYKSLEKYNINLVNDENSEASNEAKALTNISQLKDIFDTYPLHIVQDALRLWDMTWPARVCETADLIGLCELLYDFGSFMYDDQYDDEAREVDFFPKISRALRIAWPNGKSGTSGVRLIWRLIQDAMADQFPRGKTTSEKETFGNMKYYDNDSHRIAKHLWIAQGFYSVLTQTLPMVRGGQPIAERLVQPKSVPDSDGNEFSVPLHIEVMKEKE